MRPNARSEDASRLPATAEERVELPSPTSQRAGRATPRLGITVSHGLGTGPTALAAFDAALRHAGIANFNLIRLSSVIPPSSVVEVRTDTPPPPAGSWGDRLYVVMAEMRESRPGGEAWAGIGWVQDHTGKGLFVEHEGHSRAEVEHDITASLQSLCAGRDEEFGPIQMLVHGGRCDGEPVCAVVTAAFESAPWSGSVVDVDLDALEIDLDLDDDAIHDPRVQVAVTSAAAATPSFEDFDPEAYLGEYYHHIGPENDRLLAFLVEAYRQVPDDASMLEFGVGPTIYQLIAAAGRVRSIDIADPLLQNLRAVEAWHRADPHAFDWSPFVRRTLELEGASATADAVAEREARIRARLDRVLVCDAFEPEPLLGHDDTYDVVGANFVAESITADRATWRRAVGGICRLVGPGGMLVTSALEDARSWQAGSRRFPAVPISADDLVSALRGEGLEPVIVDRTDAELVDLTPAGGEGYRGLIFVAARRT